MDPDTIRRAPSRARCLRFGHARRVVVAVELHTIADETTPELVGALRRFDDVSITRGRTVADKRCRTIASDCPAVNRFVTSLCEPRPDGRRGPAFNPRTGGRVDDVLAPMRIACPASGVCITGLRTACPSNSARPPSDGRQVWRRRRDGSARFPASRSGRRVLRCAVAVAAPRST